MLAYKKAKLTIFNAEISWHKQWASCILHMPTPTSIHQVMGYLLKPSL